MPYLTKRHVVFTILLALALAPLFFANWETVSNAHYSHAAKIDFVVRCGTITNTSVLPPSDLEGPPILAVVSKSLVIDIVQAPVFPIDAQQSSPICLLVDATLTEQQIIAGLHVIIGEPTDGPFPIKELDFAGVNLSFYRFSNNEICLSVANKHSLYNPPANASLTGIGFQLPSAEEPFFLISVAPLPQLSDQNFSLVTRQNNAAAGLLIPQEKIVLDFALASSRSFAGGNFHGGVPPSCTSSIFCVGGDFSSTTYSDFAYNTYTHFSVAQNVNRCVPESGGGSFSLSLGSP